MHNPIRSVFQLITTIATFVVMTDSVAAQFIGLGALYPPPPGNYIGSLTVTKTILPEHLSSRFTVRAQAVVAADGSITILTTVPESPTAAANVESTVTRVTRVVTIDDPGRGPFSPRRATVITVAFYIDGKPVELSVNGSLLKITYRNPPAPTPSTTPTQEPSFTSFEFALRSKSN